MVDQIRYSGLCLFRRLKGDCAAWSRRRGNKVNDFFVSSTQEHTIIPLVVPIEAKEIIPRVFGKPIDLGTDGALSERKTRIILPTVRYATFNAFPSGSASRRSRP